MFAAAVILDPARPVPGLADSKLLDAARRETLARAIRRDALAWAVASATVEEIDEMNILRASLAAMAPRRRGARRRARRGRASTACTCRRRDGRAARVVKADRLVAAVSAASILAKTARDEEMVLLDARFPGYGFARHKGYPTAEHLAALRALGPCEIHRRTFGPVREAIAQRRLPF